MSAKKSLSGGVEGHASLGGVHLPADRKDEAGSVAAPKEASAGIESGPLKTPSVRRANTSASNIKRRRLCPGSGRQEDGIAEQDSEWSAEGVRLHRLYWTGERPDWLTIDQSRMLDEADALTSQFFEYVVEQCKVPDDAEYSDHREVPMEFIDSKGNVLFPGHVDLIREWPTCGVRAIVDFKAGFVEVDSAEQNDQLASYAVMRQALRPSGYTAVAIVQPRNFGPHLSKTIFNSHELHDRRNDLSKVFYAQEQENAPLFAGEEQCRHCKAKTFCGAYREKFLVVEKYRTDAVSLLNNDDLAMYLTAIRYAVKIKDEITGEMRKRIEAGAMPGWKLRNTGDERAVKDAMGLYKALSEFVALPGVANKGAPAFTAKAFDDCRQVAWGKLEELVQSITGASEKAAKEMVKEVSTPFVTSTPKAKSPTLEKATKPALK